MHGRLLVVLEVVSVAVVSINFAKLHLFVVKVHPQLVLAEGELLSAGRVVAALPDTVEQHLVCKTFQTNQVRKIISFGISLYQSK